MKHPLLSDGYSIEQLRNTQRVDADECFVSVSQVILNFAWEVAAVASLCVKEAQGISEVAERIG
ncbi:hypothetical protein J2W32_003713 [Variovorax boronicumulans]|uniref:Uncharacterized protein n=1 Tax=Variovorax boronicumulans TaxID=436515 RepID=A0AAW8D0L8_9BURK|nr:hypothetical protein [Variovorax boronicumulans]MDP9895026.1 hypothetical protein [Variovorax boronicumulans]MDP9993989.1 hypothetical protein [Variovorax boronicumulans]MDQ0038519.1 hypothetical protein [Variovorax boronicumulans]MDQ0044683.1 hypothetical protein [Variovorax boronicumulans]MDQ0054655.1 hypothetical protein [Variovorax boronicumulans]